MTRRGLTPATRPSHSPRPTQTLWFGLRHQVSANVHTHELIPEMKHNQVSGLYGAALVSEEHVVLFWTKLQGRRPEGRTRRGDGVAPPTEKTLVIDRLYALDTAPLEPLVLVLLVQQSTLIGGSGPEPGNIPKLL